MSYTDYKKVYVDKAQTLEDWKKSNPSANPRVRTKSDILSDYKTLKQRQGILQAEYDSAVEAAKRAEKNRSLLSDEEREAVNKKLWDTKVALRDLDDPVNKLRVEGAKKNLVFATELSKIYDVAGLAVIRDKVRNAPENIRILWNRFEGEMKILDKHHRGGSWYEYDSKHYGIVFDIDDDKFSKLQKPHRTIFHELESVYTR